MVALGTLCYKVATHMQRTALPVGLLTASCVLGGCAPTAAPGPIYASVPAPRPPAQWVALPDGPPAPPAFGPVQWVALPESFSPPPSSSLQTAPIDVYVFNGPRDSHELNNRLAAADDPADPISPGALAVLQQIETQSLPILTTILASTLKPRDVEKAAAAGTLTGSIGHPGTTFLGAVGEALIVYNLRHQSTGFLPGMAPFSTNVILQPGKSIVPPGTGLPDLLVTQVGASVTFLGLTMQQSVTWNNTIGPGTGGLVSTINHGPNTVLSVWEITTSASYGHIFLRAQKVAKWATALGLIASIPGHVKAAVLAIDRGAYFSLPAAEQTAVMNTVTGAGGYIALFRNFRSIAIQDAKAIESMLQPVSRP